MRDGWRRGDATCKTTRRETFVSDVWCSVAPSECEVRNSECDGAGKGLQAVWVVMVGPKSDEMRRWEERLLEATCGLGRSGGTGGKAFASDVSS
jgi:hypothetical protein